MAKTTVEEKRLYPRVKMNLKLAVSEDTNVVSINLSEGGLSFNSTDAISSPEVSLNINFPGMKSGFKTKGRLAWKRNLEDGTSLYGIEFIDLTEMQRSNLRKKLISTQIKELLYEIRSHELRKQISDFFFKDVLYYINELLKFASHFAYTKTYSENSQKAFDHLTTQVLLKGYCLDELFTDKKIIEKVKDHFRQLVGTWIYKSVIVKRAFEKPRGYPGDYKMIEIVYDNRTLSKGFGMYSDNSFLKSPYAVAVRIRKDKLRELLQDFIIKSSLSKINILNIACGSCREIKELLHSIKNEKPITFTCLDWDEEALVFSKKSLLQKSGPENIKFKFVKEDIMNIIKSDVPEQAYGEYDLVYSIGLIDYLPDRILKKLINVLYRLLVAGGKLVLTHKNKDKTFPSLPPDWFCDWKFISRSKEEVVKLFHNSGLSEFSLLTECDDFEYIYYFTIGKK